MPSPHETLFLLLASPVPTQTMFGSRWNSATSPMDADAYLSTTGVHVVPELTDLNTPPDADATYTVANAESTASMSTTLPPMLDGPRFRHRNPDSSMESEGCAAAVLAIVSSEASERRRRRTGMCMTFGTPDGVCRPEKIMR